VRETDRIEAGRRPRWAVKDGIVGEAEPAAAKINVRMDGGANSPRNIWKREGSDG